MIAFLKILIILAVMAVLAYPLLPLPSKAKKYATFYTLRYESPHNKKNLFFVLLAFVCFVLVAAGIDLFYDLGEFLCNLPFVGRLFSGTSSLLQTLKKLLGSQLNFILFVVTVLAANIITLYAFVVLKGILKKGIIDRVYGIKAPKKEKKKRKPFFLVRLFKKLFGRKRKGENPTPTTEMDTPTPTPRKKERIPAFEHSTEEDEEIENEPAPAEDPAPAEVENENRPKHGPVYRFLCGLLFEGDDFEYARGGTLRTRVVLQTFIYIIEAVYALFFAMLLGSLLFPLPAGFYRFFLDVMHVDEWYMYPFISVIFLQEICNFIHAPAMPAFDEEEQKVVNEEEEDRRRDAKLRALQSELKRRFDAEHLLRYYSEAEKAKKKEYVCTNQAYASALRYIRKYMEENSGTVMQSYMECLDAIYNDNHVYFPASFYSEFGEYLTAYTYIRLLSGARMIFVVSDPEQCESLKLYIRNRLQKMTGSGDGATWRVYTADERLDQADVLITSPADFKDDNMVEQFPGFFEEASNAVFIDSDRLIALDSYLCLIMARRLQKATGDRIRFVFLSLDWLKGFATGSLPKFFCIEKVLSFSSAAENEEVSYTLWQKESKNHRIYNKNGQKLTSLECVLAELACEHDVDGVRLLSEAPLGHAERKILALHDVEINNMYKGVADVNFMIYSDERCNLSAALYACMRFRGRKRSIVHILSKPYLLREYFMFKAAYEKYVNRSSFIQPRVTEHAERQKISLLRIFCDVTAEQGISVPEFEKRMRDILAVAIERGDKNPSEFCREMLASVQNDVSRLRHKELAAYLIAGLYDAPGCAAAESEGHRAKDYYLIVDPNRQDGYALYEEKCILFNRVKDIFEKLLVCNRRVALCLNDEVIGELDTFPTRVHREYLAGQSITYNNAEYEIEHIAEDGSAIFLRSENTGVKNCLDTVLLRRYQVESMEPRGKEGVLHNTKAPLEEIRVSEMKTNFVGETYGFYSLMTDRQTLDFYRGVEGNPHVKTPSVRPVKGGRALRVTLIAKQECTDGMRLLLSAVFNEFIRTIFPRAYHCIAICPVLETPLPFNDVHEPISENERISALYPYLKSPGEEFIESDKHRMQFLFFNDCDEDIGALDWFYDKAGRYMQEFLANVYSYLHWLQKNATHKKHYIYFGGEALPECYDLDGCCELLKDLNLLLSDDGRQDFETAGQDEIMEETERCSFCHRIMENGRYSMFDGNRYICADCFNTVDNAERLEKCRLAILRYLQETYPDVRFGKTLAELDEVYERSADEILSEFYYRLDTDSRTVFVERDSPETNAEVSILRGAIGLWQSDNDLLIAYARAQLYFEELLYLHHLGKDESADWIYNNLPEDVRPYVDEIAEFVGVSLNFTLEAAIAEQETPASEEEPAAGEDAEGESADAPAPSEIPEAPAARIPTGETSFSFMRKKAKELEGEEEPSKEDYDLFEEEDEKTANSLYDPDKVPRLWKRYLRNEKLDDGKEEELPTPEDPETPDEPTDPVGDPTEPTDPNGPEDPAGGEEEPVEREAEPMLENSPPPGGVDAPEKPADEPADEPAPTEEPVDEPAEEPAPTEEPADEPADEPAPTDEPVDEPVEEPAPTDEPATEPVEEPAPTDEPVEDKKKKKEKKKKEKKPKEKKEKKKKEKGKGLFASIAAFFARLFGKKKKDDPAVAEDPKKNGKKGSKKKKQTGKRLNRNGDPVGVFGKLSPGEKIIPFEEDEKTNPKIRFYNELARNFFNYSDAPIDRKKLSDMDVLRIFRYVLGDYPEIFWVSSFVYTPETMTPKYRCLNAQGQIDKKQVNEKRIAIRKGAKEFTAGISRRTDPYTALLTLYRRVILTLDYDGKGLDSGIGEDMRKDDSLRSLYSALVDHKVVCAGYAAAMQYLMQSIGLVCGYVSSEPDKSNSTHAFNIVKIGREVYYLDATWGDTSNTKSGDAYKDTVLYDYFCTPYKEFTANGTIENHIPRKELYPMLETFHYNAHEFFRYHKAYLTKYNEEEIIRILADAASAYDEKNGDFIVGIRFVDKTQMEYAKHRLVEKRELFPLLAKAAAATKKRKAKALLEQTAFSSIPNEQACTLYFLFPND